MNEPCYFCLSHNRSTPVYITCIAHFVRTRGCWLLYCLLVFCFIKECNVWNFQQNGCTNKRRSWCEWVIKCAAEKELMVPRWMDETFIFREQQFSRHVDTTDVSSSALQWQTLLWANEQKCLLRRPWLISSSFRTIVCHLKRLLASLLF